MPWLTIEEVLVQVPMLAMKFVERESDDTVRDIVMPEMDTWAILERQEMRQVVLNRGFRGMRVLIEKHPKSANVLMVMEFALPEPKARVEKPEPLNSDWFTPEKPK